MYYKLEIKQNFNINSKHCSAFLSCDKLPLHYGLVIKKERKSKKITAANPKQVERDQ